MSRSRVRSTRVSFASSARVVRAAIPYYLTFQPFRRPYLATLQVAFGKGFPVLRVAAAAFADKVDMRDMLPRITAPALLLTNEHNKLVSREAFEQWRSQLPNGELVVMPVDGFHIAASHPDECAEIVMRFIRACQARAATATVG